MNGEYISAFNLDVLPPPSLQTPIVMAMLTRSSSSSGLIDLFVTHRTAANMMMIFMIIFGIFAIGRINTQFLPTISIPVVTVAISWPGASAEDVEANILAVMEPELRYLNSVKRLTSRAREGMALIGLEYEIGYDMVTAQREVESAVKAVRNLPKDAERPIIKQAIFFDRVARLAITGDVSEKTLQFYAKKIRDDLIDRGIDKIVYTGMRNRELQIDIDEYELRRLGLTIGDVSRHIARNIKDLPSGQIKGAVEKQLRTVAHVKSVKNFSQLEIRSFVSGEKIFLKDIAQIREGFNESQPQGFINGLRAIEIEVQRAVTADTLKTNKILSDYVREVERQLPPKIHIYQYDIQANALTERILLLVRNGIGGLAIVASILFLFLNARIAFWVAAGIPVAMLATIGFMWISGQTINMVSLFALIMMLGIIVDDSIVIGEHTSTCFSNGDSPFEAAKNGAKYMVVPVSAAMITTVAAFAPMFFIGDVLGQIISVMPLVVIVVVLSSMIECFLILPGHLAHALQTRLMPYQSSHWRRLGILGIALIIGTFIIFVSSEGRDLSINETSLIALMKSYISIEEISHLIESVIRWIQATRSHLKLPIFIGTIAFIIYILLLLIEGMRDLLFRRDQKSFINSRRNNRFRIAFDNKFNTFRDGIFDWLLRLSFRWRYVTLSLALAAAIVGSYGLIKSEKVQFVFFPSAESEDINARIIFNAGTPESKAIEAIRCIEESLYDAEKKVTDGQEKVIIATFSTFGKAGRNTGDNVANIQVQLTPSEIRTIRTPDIVKAWREMVPKISNIRRISFHEPRGGPPGRDIEIQLQGDSIVQLKKAAIEIMPIIESIPGATSLSDDLPYGKPELVIRMKPKGRALGFTIDDVGKQLRDAFEGAIPKRFSDGDDEITVRVSKISREKGSSALRHFEFRNSKGEFVPLTDIAFIEEDQSFSSIERIDGKATVSLMANLDLKRNTTEKAQKQLEEFGISTIADRYGITYRYSGRAEERINAFNDLGIGTIIALLVIYIILASIFSNYWRPFAIMLIIPFGMVGAVVGHWLVGMKLTILSFIGLLGLTGILVNDSIILISCLDERIKNGDSNLEAAVGASKDRLRAVLLTSLTTIGGLIPLMFEKSLQAQFLLPMATTMVFGLALATLLVLFLVPVLIGIGTDLATLSKCVFVNAVRLLAPPKPWGKQN
ncbi:efflux RND transporter permease subunit [Candidatus Endowatersipora endosymbiont of Watersipora subatra]|uniref:efflux RND transporter permease subunit n=1 Tax=Candidatus Endowatersipora endosymbiont of Watersipora subatra TaxID=3077946 RepID=UPI00312C6CDC